MRVLILTLLLVVSFGANSQEPAREVSIIDLLTDSKEILDGRVMVKGFLARGTGGHLWLYITQEDSIIRNRALAVVIDPLSPASESSSCEERFVRIVSEFDILDALQQPGLRDLEEILAYDMTGDFRDDGVCWEMAE